jgi:hypothetical protein
VKSWVAIAPAVETSLAKSKIHGWSMNLSTRFTLVTVLSEYHFTVTKYAYIFIYGHCCQERGVFVDVALAGPHVSSPILLHFTHTKKPTRPDPKSAAIPPLGHAGARLPASLRCRWSLFLPIRSLRHAACRHPCSMDGTVGAATLQPRFFFLNSLSLSNLSSHVVIHTQPRHMHAHTLREKHSLLCREALPLDDTVATLFLSPQPQCSHLWLK